MCSGWADGFLVPAGQGGLHVEIPLGWGSLGSLWGICAACMLTAGSLTDATLGLTRIGVQEPWVCWG